MNGTTIFNVTDFSNSTAINYTTMVPPINDTLGSILTSVPKELDYSCIIIPLLLIILIFCIVISYAECSMDRANRLIISLLNRVCYICLCSILCCRAIHCDDDDDVQEQEHVQLAEVAVVDDAGQLQLNTVRVVPAASPLAARAYLVPQNRQLDTDDFCTCAVPVPETQETAKTNSQKQIMTNMKTIFEEEELVKNMVKVAIPLDKDRLNKTRMEYEVMKMLERAKKMQKEAEENRLCFRGTLDAYNGGCAAAKIEQKEALPLIKDGVDKMSLAKTCEMEKEEEKKALELRINENANDLKTMERDEGKLMKSKGVTDNVVDDTESMDAVETEDKIQNKLEDKDNLELDTKEEPTSSMNQNENYDSFDVSESMKAVETEDKIQNMLEGKDNLAFDSEEDPISTTNQETKQNICDEADVMKKFDKELENIDIGNSKNPFITGNEGLQFETSEVLNSFFEEKKLNNEDSLVESHGEVTTRAPPPSVSSKSPSPTELSDVNLAVDETVVSAEPNNSEPQPIGDGAYFVLYNNGFYI